MDRLLLFQCFCRKGPPTGRKTLNVYIVFLHVAIYQTVNAPNWNVF